MYDGMVDTSGLIMWSRKEETCSVGPLQPLTISLIPCGVLWRCVGFLPCLRDAGRHVCMCLCSLLLSYFSDAFSYGGGGVSI